MQRISASISDFEKLRRDGYRYVDKTEYLWDLVMPAGESYFLSRPRRFGKSLALSTLKAIFQGRRDLFDGLAIAQKDYDWKPYPIIHLDFADYDTAFNTPELLNDYLRQKLDECAAEFGVTLPPTPCNLIAFSLEDLIHKLSQQARVVILVDEYNKPILDNLNNPALPELQGVLESLYAAIKCANARERFVLLTGVSDCRFSSFMQSINHLTDISDCEPFADMLGFTQQEIEENFGDRLDDACRQLRLTRQSLLDRIQEWYGGYLFDGHAERVHNPVSVIRFLSNGYYFQNYWSNTGTPHLPVKLMMEQNCNLEMQLACPYSSLCPLDVSRLDAFHLLIETGYLTIRCAAGRHGHIRNYYGFPNLDISKSFIAYLLNAYTTIREDTIKGFMRRMASCLRGHDLDGFMEAMRSLLAAIPYDIHLRHEKYYQTVFYVTFLLLGTTVQAEARTSTGRIDALIQTPERVYIFEFKLDRSAQAALDQIRDRDYFRQFAGGDRPVTLVGAAFDGETRQLGDWLVQQA